MEDWQKDLVKFVDDVSVEIEHFFTDISDAVETLTDEVTDTFETFSNFLIEDFQNLTNQLEDSMIIYFDEYYQYIWDEVDLEIEIDYPEQRVRDNYENDMLDINPKIQPNLVNQSACINCSNYHGRIYGGNLLVCAMHPYGWGEENCPDWVNDNS